MSDAREALKQLMLALEQNEGNDIVLEWRDIDTASWRTSILTVREAEGSTVIEVFVDNDSLATSINGRQGRLFDPEDWEFLRTTIIERLK